MPVSQYIVRPGDTLSGIYGANWKQLSGYSGDPSQLRVGTVLPAPPKNNFIQPTQVKPITAPAVLSASTSSLPMPKVPSVPQSTQQSMQSPAPTTNAWANNTVANTQPKPQEAQDNSLTSTHPTTNQATSQAIKAGANPSVLERARQYLGENAYIGLCQAFVERATQGKEGLYTSAIDAWNKQQDKAQTNLANIKPGDAVYFGPNGSNRGFGHTGIYVGNNQFISATNNGIKQVDLGDWMKSTGQHLLGFIPTGANDIANTLMGLGKDMPDWATQQLEQQNTQFENFGKGMPTQSLDERPMPDPYTAALDAIFGITPPISRMQGPNPEKYNDIIRAVPL